MYRSVTWIRHGSWKVHGKKMDVEDEFQPTFSLRHWTQFESVLSLSNQLTKISDAQFFEKVSTWHTFTQLASIFLIQLPSLKL